MNRLTNLLGHPLPVAQKGNKVLTVAPQQVIRHFLADEDLGSLDDFADGQGRVVVVVLVVNAVRVAAHHLLQQLHAHHSLPAEDGLDAGHGGCRAFIWTREGQPGDGTTLMFNYNLIEHLCSSYKHPKPVHVSPPFCLNTSVKPDEMRPSGVSKVTAREPVWFI